MKLKLRLQLGLILIAIAAIVGFLSNQLPSSTATSSLLLNMATELGGIAVTIFMVDYILNRRDLIDDVNTIALEALDEVDHHVWVWQGGARGFDLIELAALIEGIDGNDPIPDFTQNLFLNLGSRAANTFRTRKEAVSASIDLRKGLTSLSALERMRDKDRHLDALQIRQSLIEALPHLARAARLDLPTELPRMSYQVKNSSVKHQKWRHYGLTIKESQADVLEDILESADRPPKN